MSDEASQEVLSADNVCNTDEQGVVYSNDAEDKKFIHCLIRTTEQYVLLQRLRRDASEAVEKATELQRTHDDHINDLKLYEKCNEPALESLIEYTKHEADETYRELQKWTRKFADSEFALKKNKTRRRQLVQALYDDSERFIRRTLFQNDDYGLLEFDVHFLRALARLRASAQELGSLQRA